MTKPTITYVRMGPVERPRRRGQKVSSFMLHDGFSENGTHQPWLTRREAAEDAKKRGAKAVFLDKPSKWERFTPQECDTCDRVAIWRHPEGGFRCDRCPRPEEGGYT